VKVEMVDRGLQVAWQPVLGAKKYTVFWGFSPGQYRGMLDTTDNAVILAGLAKGEMLYLAVTAWNERGESHCSGEQAVVNDDDPGRANLYTAKGQEALQKGAYLDADAYLSAAIRLNPQNAEAYRYRGMLYERLSKAGLAQEDYQRAEKIFKSKLLSKKRVTG
jgi:tetratricopeptide (TPR) repeat protein